MLCSKLLSRGVKCSRSGDAAGDEASIIVAAYGCMHGHSSDCWVMRLPSDPSHVYAAEGTCARHKQAVASVTLIYVHTLSSSRLPIVR